MEQDVHRFPELAEQTVTAGEFPGSMRIPGSDAALRIGGHVRMTSVNSFDPIGTEDRFVTSSIPVEGSEAARKGDRTTYSAAPSRYNFDLRTPTGVGAMRAFIEGDFAGSGSGNLFRLRHAYGQWRKLTVGQTWSTFSDPEAEPNGIDREGLNAISLFRQAQFRWTHPFGERLALALAAENPAPNISAPDGSPVPGVNQVPDLVARLRWTPGEKTLVHGSLGNWRHDRLSGGGHVQLAFVLRQIRGEYDPNATLSTLGAGVHYSGRITSPLHADRDRILFALSGGWGIGRYITDLGAAGRPGCRLRSRDEHPRGASRPVGIRGLRALVDPHAALDGHLGNGLRRQPRRADGRRVPSQRPRHAQPVVVAHPADRHRGRVPLGPTDQQGRPARRGAPAPDRHHLPVLKCGGGLR